MQNKKLLQCSMVFLVFISLATVAHAFPNGALQDKASLLPSSQIYPLPHEATDFGDLLIRVMSSAERQRLQRELAKKKAQLRRAQQALEQKRREKAQRNLARQRTLQQRQRRAQQEAQRRRQQQMLRQRQVRQPQQQYKRNQPTVRSSRAPQNNNAVRARQLRQLEQARQKTLAMQRELQRRRALQQRQRNSQREAQRGRQQQMLRQRQVRQPQQQQQYKRNQPTVRSSRAPQNDNAVRARQLRQLEQARQKTLAIQRELQRRRAAAQRKQQSPRLGVAPRQTQQQRQTRVVSPNRPQPRNQTVPRKLQEPAVSPQFRQRNLRLLEQAKRQTEALQRQLDQRKALKQHQPTVPRTTTSKQTDLLQRKRELEHIRRNLEAQAKHRQLQRRNPSTTRRPPPKLTNRQLNTLARERKLQAVRKTDPRSDYVRRQQQLKTIEALRQRKRRQEQQLRARASKPPVLRPTKQASSPAASKREQQLRLIEDLRQRKRALEAQLEAKQSRQANRPPATPNAPKKNVAAKSTVPDSKSVGLTANDKRWADTLPSDLKKQVYGIRPEIVDAMKRNGRWKYYQSTVMDTLNVRTNEVEARTFADTYSKELDKNANLGCDVPVVGSGACAISAGKALSEKRYLDAGSAALNAAPIGKALNPVKSTYNSLKNVPLKLRKPAPLSNKKISEEADKISNGHAFDKHVLRRGEFQGDMIRTRPQFAKEIEETMKNYTHSGQLKHGRSWYYNERNNMLVLRNPNSIDGGTAFKVDRDLFPDPFKYLNNLR